MNPLRDKRKLALCGWNLKSKIIKSKIIKDYVESE